MAARIIIADDEPLIRMDLREGLTALGYEVAGEAADGLEAIRLAREVRPDLVVMDVKMPPGLDGVTAAGRLKAEGLAPVLFLTAYSDPALVAQAREAGGVGFIVKPVVAASLRPAIELAVAQAAALRHASEQADRLREELEAIAQALLGADPPA